MLLDSICYECEDGYSLFETDGRTICVKTEENCISAEGVWNELSECVSAILPSKVTLFNSYYFTENLPKIFTLQQNLLSGFSRLERSFALFYLYCNLDLLFQWILKSQVLNAIKHFPNKSYQQ